MIGLPQGFMLGPAVVSILRNGLGKRVSKEAAQFATDAKFFTVAEYEADSKEFQKDLILLSSMGVKLEVKIQSQ